MHTYTYIGITYIFAAPPIYIYTNIYFFILKNKKIYIFLYIYFCGAT